MQRILSLLVVVSIFSLLLLSCCGRSSREEEKKAQENIPQPLAKEKPAPIEPVVQLPPPQPVPEGDITFNLPSKEETEKREKYESTLADALGRLAEGELSQALEAMETAQKLQDSPFLQGEIAKLKARINQ